MYFGVFQPTERVWYYLHFKCIFMELIFMSMNFQVKNDDFCISLPYTTITHPLSHKKPRHRFKLTKVLTN